MKIKIKPNYNKLGFFIGVFMSVVDYLRAYLPSDIVIQDEKLGDNGCSLMTNIKIHGKKFKFFMTQEMVQDIVQVLNNVYSDRTGPIQDGEVVEWKETTKQLDSFFENYDNIYKKHPCKYFENDGTPYDRQAYEYWECDVMIDN